MVVISNGFNKFHLAVAAAEAQGRGILSAFITGAYPTASIRRRLGSGALRRSRKAARLLARRERIPDTLVRALWPAEALYAVATGLRPASTAAADQLTALSFMYYGHLAVKHVREAAARGARVYHYRSGFGHRSAREANRLGMLTICDHSIAHPVVLRALVEGGGKFPMPGQNAALDRFWSDVLADIEQADAVVVNSTFVRSTFDCQGCDSRRIHVVEWGVDDAFVDELPARAGTADVSAPLRLLFAGGFNRRKGAEALTAALQLLADVSWRLEIAGSVDPDASQLVRALAKDPRVSITGWLPRRELARRMSVAEVLVLPSLAEGSARVVFEALAAGCYVITTPNAGSIVEDRIHGRLIDPGGAVQLAAAIREAAAERLGLAEIGRRNAELIRARYRQRQYGQRLAALYQDLLARKASRNAA